MNSRSDDGKPADESPAPSADAPFSLGHRLKQLRKRQKLTLQQASERTGVGVSTLSKIERDDLSPTITTLQRIAQGLDIDSASLLAPDDHHLRVAGRRSVYRKNSAHTHATETCHNTWLCSDLTHKAMNPLLTTVDARRIEDYPSWARYDAEVFLYVLSGTVVVHSQIYEPVRLHAGDATYYDASTPHLWLSEGDAPAQVIWVYTNY